jgi:hypothetical protein
LKLKRLKELLGCRLVERVRKPPGRKKGKDSVLGLYPALQGKRCGQRDSCEALHRALVPFDL